MADYINLRLPHTHKSSVEHINRKSTQNRSSSLSPSVHGKLASVVQCCWAEVRIEIARMTLTIKLDGSWSSFQLANSAPPLSVTDSAIAPAARMVEARPSGMFFPISFYSCCWWGAENTKKQRGQNTLRKPPTLPFFWVRCLFDCCRGWLLPPTTWLVETETRTRSMRVMLGRGLLRNAHKYTSLKGTSLKTGPE